ncbi:MAG: hypothetical protein ACFBQW_00185 [Sphingomonadaceae bacterium]
MIVVVATASHTYTHEELAGLDGAVEIEVKTYHDLHTQGLPPDATYIFTDVDRLPASTHRWAALQYRQLRKKGVKVLNDPARMLSRQGLLRRLARLGINDFNAYRVEEGIKPAKWPVFIRSIGDHGFPVSGLLHDIDELHRAIGKSLARGFPLPTLLVVEYAAEPVREGLYRKLSVFKVGQRLLGYTCVHDDNWVVKFGKNAIATDELYEEEYRFVRDNPFGAAAARVFEAAGVEYGRVDFGLVGGKPQFYEVNSNPHVKLDAPETPHPRRAESLALFRELYVEAMRAIDTPAAEGAPREKIA